MQFGLDKCATLHAVRGKVQSSKGITLDHNSLELPYLHPPSIYKYLGVCQALQLSTKSAKEKTIETLTFRIHEVLSSALNAKNKIKALNSWCFPVLMYTFGILSWSKTELESLDRKIRTQLTEFRIHHPKSCIQRLYLRRIEGGRGLINLEHMANSQIHHCENIF